MNRSTYRRHTWAARSLSRPPKRTWTTPLRRCSTSALKRPWPFNGPHPGSGAPTTGGPRESPLRTGPTGKLGTAHSLPPQGGGTAPAGPGKITPHTVLSPNTQPTAQHYQPGGQARSSTQPKSPTEAPSQGHPKKSFSNDLQELSTWPSQARQRPGLKEVAHQHKFSSQEAKGPATTAATPQPGQVTEPASEGWRGTLTTRSLEPPRPHQQSPGDPCSTKDHQGTHHEALPAPAQDTDSPQAFQVPRSLFSSMEQLKQDLERENQRRNAAIPLHMERSNNSLSYEEILSNTGRCRGSCTTGPSALLLSESGSWGTPWPASSSPAQAPQPLVTPTAPHETGKDGAPTRAHSWRPNGPAPRTTL